MDSENESPQRNTIAELLDLKAKSAVVTGGAEGIGAAIAHRLAEAGAAVLIADINAAAAEKTAAAIRTAGYRASSCACDVSREEDVKNMVAAAVEQTRSIDIVVNNAGIYPRKPLLEMTGEDFERVVDINLLGTFLCSRYAAARMIEGRRGGCIINIASIEAVHPSSTGMAAYDASKAGVVMLTKSLARELGRDGIRVNAIAPGAILTRAVASHVGNQTVEEGKKQMKELKAFMARMALGRMGDADDIARVVLFLASELADYITGELIVVDGGYLIS